MIPNIRTLRDNLKAEGWHITAFNFSYNKYDYVVIFEDSKGVGIADLTTIAILTFVDIKDITRRLEIKANTKGFTVGIKDFCEFFKINSYPKNPRDFMVDFYRFFNKYVPENFVSPKTEFTKDLISTKLGERNGDKNPDGKYCYDIRRLPIDSRNGKQKHRSIFNDNKTKLLYRNLYDLIAVKDNTLSFYYSPNKTDEKSDAELLKILASRGLIF